MKSFKPVWAKNIRSSLSIASSFSIFGGDMKRVCEGYRSGGHIDKMALMKDYKKFGMDVKHALTHFRSQHAGTKQTSGK